MAEDDPSQWSLLRQHLEASKIVKRLKAGSPHQTLSEAFLRNVLADQLGIKPKEVTLKQIAQAVGDLLRDDPSLGSIAVAAATETRMAASEDEEWERELRRINLELAAYDDVFRPPGVGARDSRPEAPEEIQQQIALLKAKRARLAEMRSEEQRQEGSLEEPKAFTATRSSTNASPVAMTPMEEKRSSRTAFVDPLLKAKGWSILDWANDAKVSHATAMDYLQGKTSPYRSTRLKLAKALGVSVERLPS
jgi:lambda repressor-like predicted transcriptional regulator